MNQYPADIAALILQDLKFNPIKTYTAFAPVNIALCKYWGKRNEHLNLPVNDSLSVSLNNLGSHTTVEITDSSKIDVYLNNTTISHNSRFYQRIEQHINLFKPFIAPCGFKINTKNNIATAAGIASSASGFAALTKALVGVLGLTLSSQTLSILARLGSGSACRSIEPGFVHWSKGTTENGMDSYGHTIDAQWPNLCVGLLTLTSDEKKVSSRNGMANTVKQCPLYKSWPKQAEQDLTSLLGAIENKDFTSLGKVAEQNALAMHATMIATQPPLLYWQPESVLAMQKVWQLREQGLDVYFTMDAGPNLKLLFQEKNLSDISSKFPDIQIVMPFGENPKRF